MLDVPSDVASSLELADEIMVTNGVSSLTGSIIGISAGVGNTLLSSIRIALPPESPYTVGSIVDARLVVTTEYRVLPASIIHLTGQNTAEITVLS